MNPKLGCDRSSNDGDSIKKKEHNVKIAFGTIINFALNKYYGKIHIIIE